MSVYVDLSSISDSASGQTDLYSISWNDGALSQGAGTTLATSIGSVNVAQVVYPATSGSSVGVSSAERLVELVNTTTGDNWDFPILITPINASVNSTEPYNGTDIAGNGATFLDSSENVIHVCYDTSQCTGSGIYAYDTSNTQIATPNCVILYHELSHAYHFAINQIPFQPGTLCPGNTSDEPAAEADENVMRMELGLCPRDVCNHDAGCGSGVSCGGSATPGGPPLGSGGSSGGGGSNGGGGCFIVTAATGSAQSNEVVRLRQLRDRISAVSGLSSQLIDGIYREYYQFSPAIADDIGGSYAIREAVRRMIVRPLFAWYTLATTLGLEPDDRTAVSLAAQELLDACPRLAGEYLVTPILEAIRTDRPLPPAAPRQLGEFLPAIRRAMKLPLAAWAIFDPMMRAWTLASRHADVVAEVARWLADAPIEKYVPPSDPELLDREIATLAGFLNFHPASRSVLGIRLAAAWPEVADTLRRHGFIEKTSL